MKDILLEADHDIMFEKNDLLFAVNSERVKQKLKIKLLHIYGEWFLDTDAGVKYKEIIWVKNPDLDVIESLLKSEIMETENIKELEDFRLNFDEQTRKINITFSAVYTDGELLEMEVSL